MLCCIDRTMREPKNFIGACAGRATTFTEINGAAINNHKPGHLDSTHHSGRLSTSDPKMFPGPQNGQVRRGLSGTATFFSQSQNTQTSCCIEVFLHCRAPSNLIHDRWNCLVRIPSLNTNTPPPHSDPTHPFHLNKPGIAGCLCVFPRPCLEVG